MKDFSHQHCGRMPDPKACYLEQLGLTPEERTALRIARYFFQAFSHPNSLGWVSAFAEADRQFGTSLGPRIAARLLAILQLMRRARRSAFMFNSPTCPGCAALATEHERRLMVSLAALRRGDSTAARVELMMLCEGNDWHHVMAALSILAHVLDEHHPTAKERAPARDRLQ